MEHSNIQHLNMQKEAEGTISGNSTAIQRTDEQIDDDDDGKSCYTAWHSCPKCPDYPFRVGRFWTITGDYATYKGGKL